MHKPKAYTVYSNFIVSLVYIITSGTHDQVRALFNTDSALMRKGSS